MAGTMSYGQGSRILHFKASGDLEKRVRGGKRNINLSEEIRRLLELGLQAEGR